MLRAFRRAPLGAGWLVRHESPGRLRLQNERLHRRREVCQAIERELMSVLGIDNYKTGATTGTVLVLYNTRQLNPAQVVEILDSALAQAEAPRRTTNLIFIYRRARSLCHWRRRPSL